MGYEELFYIATNHPDLSERYKAARTLKEYQRKNVERFDSDGRMYYNPKYHFTYKQHFTEEEMAYLCKFHDVDGFKSLSMALGKTPTVITMKYSRLKKKAL